MKVLIGVPCMDMVNAQFAMSLATMDKAENTAVSFVIGSLIYDARNNLVKQALKMGADYLVFFDSDMTFKKDTLTKLLAHLDNGADIVSGMYYKRVPPYEPVIYKSIEPPKAKSYIDYPTNAVFEAEGVGFGCVAIRTSILYDIALKFNNWFEPVNTLGEDLAFCWRARQCGYKILVDSSIQCGHIGHAIITEEVFKMVGGADNVSTSKESATN